jgi:vancomycin resistance protein YoaR
MAVQYARPEIVECNAHYAVLPYMRPGFDATVWFGAKGAPELGMQFENTTDGNVPVRKYVDDKGFLNAEIRGRPNGKEVTSFNPPPPEGAPSYDTTAPRVAGWEAPNNTAGRADAG